MRRWAIFYELLRLSVIELMVFAGIVVAAWAILQALYRLKRRW